MVTTHSTCIEKWPACKALDRGTASNFPSPHHGGDWRSSQFLPLILSASVAAFFAGLWKGQLGIWQRP